MQNPVAPTQVYADDRVFMFSCCELFLAVWFNAPTPVQMEAFAKYGWAHERALPNGGLLSNLAVRGTPTFDEQVRRQAAELTADPELFRIARSHTILMDGLKGVAVRAFVQTFLLLGRPPRPTKVFDTVEHGAEWMAEQLRSSPHGWTADKIAAFHHAAWKLAEG